METGAPSVSRRASKSVGIERLNRLFGVLSEELQNAKPRTEAQAAAFQRLSSRMRKRAALGDKSLRDTAIQKFLETNDRVGSVVVDLDRSLVDDARYFIHRSFVRFNTRNDETLEDIPYDYRMIHKYWRFGPGTSNGVRGTHTAQKLDQPMTCTLLAIPLVAQLRGNNTYLRAYDLANRCEVPVVRGSRMTTVPKNEDTERTIAIEPSGNMAIQLALGRYIEDVLRSIGLDIRKQQPLNKELARKGSITGGFATLDLSAASDSFSIPLIKALFPPGLFDTMLRVRSPVAEMPDGSEVKLNMMSTMGNGFTFPMMTLCLTALIYAMRLRRGGPQRWVDWTKTAVFGDDLIVETHEAEELVQLLGKAGLIVNCDKSFLTGPFRESCGGDYWLGEEITPFYIKELAVDAHVYTALNKVYEWCARENFLLWRTIQELRGMLDGAVRFVPEWCGDDSGFRTSLVTGRYTYLKPLKADVRYTGRFAMMLAVGGYLSPDGPDFLFTPRPKNKTRYVVGRARVPKGFLSGVDPLSRSAPVSAYVESYSFLLQD